MQQSRRGGRRGSKGRRLTKTSGIHGYMRARGSEDRGVRWTSEEPRWLDSGSSYHGYCGS